MDLATLAKKANINERKPFTAKLPSRLQELRKEKALDSIFRRESAYSKQRDISKAIKAIHNSPDLTMDQKNQITTAIQQKPSGMGRLLAAGIAAVGAPLLLGSISDKVPGYIKGFSIPIAALGGASLFDLVSKPRNAHQFSKAYPMVSDNSIRRWTGQE